MLLTLILPFYNFPISPYIYCVAFLYKYNLSLQLLLYNPSFRSGAFAIHSAFAQGQEMSPTVAGARQ